MDIKKSYGDNKALRGKVAVITGAGSGIGKASVSLFLQEGADCVAADLNYDSVVALLEEFPEYREHIRPFQVDVSQSDQVEAMVDFAVREFGQMDILFNNAGIMDGMVPVDELSDQVWDRVMRINASGVMYACRKAVRYYLERGEGGVILNTASLGGLYGGRAGLAYTASKFAVVGMTKNIAFMYGDAGIRCNAICPGGYNPNLAPDDPFVETYKTHNMLNRWAEKDDIKGPVIFLASEASRYVTGSTIVMDGGWTVW